MSTRVILYGRPYCGKGTIAKMLLAELEDWDIGKAKNFLMSDCLRRYAGNPDTPSDHAEHIRYCQNNGRIVNAEVAKIAFNRDEFGDFDFVIYDGVPRTPAQVEWFTASNDQIIVIHFDLSRELALERRETRIQESRERGEVPRADDINIHTANSRQDEFENHHPRMLSLLGQLAEDGFHTVPGTLSVDERCKSVIQFISSLSTARL